MRVERGDLLFMLEQAPGMAARNEAEARLQRVVIRRGGLRLHAIDQLGARLAAVDHRRGYSAVGEI
jgi:multidrug resistance efflux pump